MNNTGGRTVNVLIKPSSGLCNLRCVYCFYHSPELKDGTDEKGFMKEETAEWLIKRTYEYADGGVVFAFQGGEPTLRGLDFYKFFVKTAKKHNTGNVRTDYAIQTNGIAIDEDWAEFLAENKFLAGLSIDGPSSVHNENRVDPEGKSTLKKVMRTKRLFDEKGVEYNALTVVTSKTAEKPIQTYEFFKRNGIGFVQYIPCLDPLGEEPGLHPFSLTPKAYGGFLNTVFDTWYDDLMAGKTTVIRTFDNYIAMIMGYRPEACGMSGRCSCQFVTEADGSVYPCDFYVLGSTRIGNVAADTFEEMTRHQNLVSFLEKGAMINEKCRDCKWYFICRGGCRRYRNPETDLNIYCESFKMFFEHCYSRMEQIAAKLAGR
jgi:uncharacterized protein